MKNTCARLLIYETRMPIDLMQEIVLDCACAMVYLCAWLQHYAGLKPIRLLSLQTQKSFLRTYPGLKRIFLQPAKSGLCFCGA